ncbi:hypothetical protein [Lamprobacter modestohalophilus]|uniref:hypothetical protein n=1 Tax=Lamprobacter modestohalophilus TaxID=1064514 RepID=UPI001A91BA1D|nr:hypothetical protein [Lamprobacter modestohalophilus]
MPRRQDAARITLLSKDMNDHDHYMAIFLEIFSVLDYWGPGSEQTTRQALACLHQPLEARLLKLEGQIEGTRVLDDLRRELRAYHEGNGQFGYEMFVLARR